MEERDITHQEGLETLHEIKQMMERSSRFISLSGLSGIAAGICGLFGAYQAQRLLGWRAGEATMFDRLNGPASAFLVSQLYKIGIGTFIAAFISAFLFTWLKSRQNHIPLWGIAARKLIWAVAIPLVAGAFFLYRMIQLGQYELIAPGCLVFYGLALVNASKFTFSEIGYLGYLQILLGLINSWMPDNSLICWAIGFGALHIIYGAIMWWKYERK